MKELRNSMKLVLVLVLVVALAVTGCGKATTETATETKTETATETKTETTEAATETADDEMPLVELTWFFIGNGQQDDVEAVEAELNEYIKDKINATVKLQCFDWGSYNDKLTTMIASQEVFDI